MKLLAIVITVLLVAGVSFLVGVLVSSNRMQKAVEEGSVGYLRIDRSEPDEPPKAFWEIVGTSIEAVSKKDFVVLKVVNKDYISRD